MRTKPEWPSDSGTSTALLAHFAGEQHRQDGCELAMHLGRELRGVVLGADGAFAALSQQMERLVQSVRRGPVLVRVHPGQERFHVEGHIDHMVVFPGASVFVVHSHSLVRCTAPSQARTQLPIYRSEQGRTGEE
ncbi:hypothetical protein ABZ695_16545 [Streptomyces sp. NPDC006976]|uniref:hypothetical protein n=1 Tax=Streptomyces sp. NPDC006976 TaxID=3154311 RepID=UPI00340554C8